MSVCVECLECEGKQCQDPPRAPDGGGRGLGSVQDLSLRARVMMK